MSISETLYFLPTTMAASVAPVLTTVYRHSPEEYEGRFLQVTPLLVARARRRACGFLDSDHLSVV